MALFEKSFRGDFSQVLNALERDIMYSGMSVNLVDSSDFRKGGTRIAVRVYDKFFQRNGNRVSLSLTVAEVEDTIFVSAIGAGAGRGAFFSVTWGSEEDFVYVVEQSLANMGY